MEQNNNKAIIVVGPPRSGTSILTKIIQDHIGDPFPFEVSRHYEPVELVDIFNRWFERQGHEASRRYYFPKVKPDLKLLEEMTEFFKKYGGVKCVIKEPILSIVLRWFDFGKIFTTVGIKRGVVEVARSFAYHKRFELDYNSALNVSRWYHLNNYTLWEECDQLLEFKPRETSFFQDIAKVVNNLGLAWDYDIWQENFDINKIEHYKK